MRFSLGITLICFAVSIPSGEPPAAISIVQNIIGGTAGVLLIAGLWTPVTAAVAALDQIWIVAAPALSQPSSQPASQSAGEWIHVLLAILCVSVAMLGPGAWSIDARLFGRRRFPTHQGREEDHPPKG